MIFSQFVQIVPFSLFLSISQRKKRISERVNPPPFKPAIYLLKLSLSNEAY